MRHLHAVLVVSLIGFMCSISFAQGQNPWKMHDMSRPHPAVVQVPGEQLPVLPPSDAVVLFDGKDLSHWRAENNGPAKWVVQDGYFASVAGSGAVHSLESFGDVQLHIEWAAPVPAHGSGQGRGNSGVFLMGLYEIQVLDSYQNETYADGQAAAIYGQYPPLTNACRPPGEWQSYDIFFRHPRFDAHGTLVQPARVTVLQNGILVQDNVELAGPTSWLQNAAYKQHPDRLPFSLQDHSNPVRFRNIWARDLPEQPPKAVPTPLTSAPAALPLDVVDRYVGMYKSKDGFEIAVKRDGQNVFMNIGSDRVTLNVRSANEFAFAGVDGTLKFKLNDKGMPVECVFETGGGQTPLSRQ